MTEKLTVEGLLEKLSPDDISYLLGQTTPHKNGVMAGDREVGRALVTKLIAKMAEPDPEELKIRNRMSIALLAIIDLLPTASKEQWNILIPLRDCLIQQFIDMHASAPQVDYQG